MKRIALFLLLVFFLCGLPQFAHSKDLDGDGIGCDVEAYVRIQIGKYLNSLTCNPFHYEYWSGECEEAQALYDEANYNFILCAYGAEEGFLGH